MEKSWSSTGVLFWVLAALHLGDHHLSNPHSSLQSQHSWSMLVVVERLSGGEAVFPTKDNKDREERKGEVSLQPSRTLFPLANNPETYKIYLTSLLRHCNLMNMSRSEMLHNIKNSLELAELHTGGSEIWVLGQALSLLCQMRELNQKISRPFNLIILCQRNQVSKSDLPSWVWATRGPCRWRNERNKCVLSLLPRSVHCFHTPAPWLTRTHARCVLPSHL